MSRNLEKLCSTIEEKSPHEITTMIDGNQIVVYPDELDEDGSISEEVFEDIVDTCNDELLVLDDSKSDKDSYLYFNTN